MSMPSNETILNPLAARRAEIQAMPEWLRRPIGKASEISTVQQIIKQRQIHGNAIAKRRQLFC